MIHIQQKDAEIFLKSIKSDSVDLIVTSPPYNMGKFENDKMKFDHYLVKMRLVILEMIRVLKPTGSICWQVGNYVEKGSIRPLDIETYKFFTDENMKLRNRIIWHFGHGLHCTNRLSGRYETVMWYTNSDNYTFNLDAIRVPQKYPNKRHYHGSKKGQLSGNPLGKNPSDIWDIPNIKYNHPEKTIHPAQFPTELVRRLVLALTNEGDMVVDPFVGSGTTAVVCKELKRDCIASDINYKYRDITCDRLSE